MTVEKINKPVVHSVRYLKFGNFIQDGVSDGVEGFTKVQCYYGNIRVPYADVPLRNYTHLLTLRLTTNVGVLPIP